jgi:hypothetical protein
MAWREGLFYEVGAYQQRYPDWLRDLEGECGAYAIRWTDTGEVVYVGESHSGHLRKTLTRHLQAWQTPHWFDEMSGRGEDLSYPREEVEVAVWLSNCSDAQELQVELICELQPRDNTYGTECEGDVDEFDDVPF